jgi:hypothetical protein
MAYYSSDQDFATFLLKLSNTTERCQLSARAFDGYNNKAAQLNQIHRVMNHRPHQAEF